MTKTLAVAIAAAMLLMPSKAAALENEELLTLVAMPLAVAAVSEVTDVPVSDLIDAVTVLNDAAVPPEQFIEVVRYLPVALVNEVTVEEPRFVDYIRTQEQQGVRGTALVHSIENQLAVYGYSDVELAVRRPRTIDVTDTATFIPKIVRTRLAEVRAHPHGGPPGQLKKQRGVQTGAAIVHDRSDDASNRVVTRVVEDRGSDRATASEPRKQRIATHEREPRVAKQHDDHDRGRGNDRAAHGKSRGHGGDKGNGGGGNGGGNGKGNGKGKG
ncbi:MAG TPA: hypothetical protein VE010_12710 [Thermoanaerobaculia bacterium]|nr:hypothetical protein [Thermoanaerobaculia bacterium]